MVAQRLVAEADREERLPGGEQLGDGRPQLRHLGVVAVARVARPGADDHQVEAVEAPGA